MWGLEAVQDSVFEGEITEEDAVKVEELLQSMLEPGESVLVYRMSSEKYVERTAFDADPAEDSRFL